MSDKRKITRVEGSSIPFEGTTAPFVPTSESKGKANRLRVIAGLLWLVAIIAQVVAISMILKPPINMVYVIGLIVIDLALVIIGSTLWKKSNRLDPASERNKFLFFMQSQLGLVVSVIAFLPLIIFILTSKKIDGKQKAILGSIAGAALVIAGITGVDFNPPSAEEYAEQTSRVEWLNEGQNFVYWSKSGSVYHLYNDCSYITSAKTTEVFEGTVAHARELKNISELCSRCENRAIKERGLNAADYGKTEMPAAIIDSTSN